MNQLLLVQMPAELTRRLQAEVGGDCEELSTVGDVGAQLSGQAPEPDALVVGPGRGGRLKLVELAARSDPDLGVVLLCEPDERADLRARLRFSPHPGRDVRCVPMAAEDVFVDAVRGAAEHTRLRRHHRSMLAAVEPETRPAPGFSVPPSLLLDHLLDHAPMGVFALDAELRVLAWNRRASLLLNNVEGGVLGSHIQELLPRSACAQLGALVTRALVEETTGTVVVERSPSGSALGTQYLEVCVSNMADTRGEPSVLCTLVDVTERARAEEQLLESVSRYRSLVETAPTIITSIDLERRIVEWNPAAERVFGWKREEVIGQDCVPLLIPEESWPIVTTDLPKVMSGTATTDLECPIRTRAGETRLFTWNVTRRLDANDRVSGAVAVGHDITERKRNERLLEEQKRELERSNRELEEFTTVASHDLQEPLRKLVSFSALLAEDVGSDLAPDAERDLQFISDGARRMQKLVQDLLTLSRSGRSEMKRERIAVGTCADHALDALALVVRETGAKIEREPLGEVLADPTLLTEIYQNLIGNALKFVAQRSPVIRLTAADGVLGVQDNGIGVAPEDAVEIFKPFRKLHSSAEYAGSGIGLAICRKAVERHGGRIWAEPVSTGGTQVRFTLSESPAGDARSQP